MEVFKIKVNGKVIERHATKHQYGPDRAFDAIMAEFNNYNVDADVTLTYSDGYTTLTIRTEYTRADRYMDMPAPEYGGNYKGDGMVPDTRQGVDPTEVIDGHGARNLTTKSFAASTVNEEAERLIGSDIPPGRCECGQRLGHGITDGASKGDVNL